MWAIRPVPRPISNTLTRGANRGLSRAWSLVECVNRSLSSFCRPLARSSIQRKALEGRLLVVDGGWMWRRNWSGGVAIRHTFRTTPGVGTSLQRTAFIALSAVHGADLEGQLRSI